MKYRLLKAVLPMLLLTGCAAEKAKEPPMRTAELFAMDTYMTLKASGEGAEAALDAASARIRELEELFSVTKEDSELNRINHSGGMPMPVSNDTPVAVGTALAVGRDTDYALNIALYPVVQAWGFTTGSYQIPSEETLRALLVNTDPKRIVLDGNVIFIPPEYQLDLGAVAKGYAGDQVTDIFTQYGITSGIVSLGGNVQALGTKPDGSRWTVGITDPAAPDSLLGTVAAADCAVITSGSYERFFEGEDGRRYWHILDPADGCPADSGLSSVTVIGKNGARCDALSTALFVMGTEKAAAYWKAERNFGMILVTDDGRILVTEDIASDLTTENGRETEVLHGDG